MTTTTTPKLRFTGTTARMLIREGTDALKLAADNVSYRSGFRDDATSLLTYGAGLELAPDDVVAAPVRRRFERAIARRATGEPIPYITGVTEFNGLTLSVRRGAFVPRWTSEAVVTEALRCLRPRRDPIHVDVATGIGPVALAVADRMPRAQVYGLDLSAKAISLASLNAQQLGLSNVTFLRGDLFAPLPTDLHGRIDVITIHPPYVAKHELDELPPEQRRFEPMMSLTDRSVDGLSLLRRTARDSEEWLRPNGRLFVEIGTYLARRACALLREEGFREIDSVLGPLKLNRIIRARR